MEARGRRRRTQKVITMPDIVRESDYRLVDRGPLAAIFSELRKHHAKCLPRVKAGDFGRSRRENGHNLCSTAQFRGKFRGGCRVCSLKQQR